jgi:hypothetical protein
MLYLCLTYMARERHESFHSINLSGTMGSVAVRIIWCKLYFALLIMPIGHFHERNIYWNVNCKVLWQNCIYTKLLVVEESHVNILQNDNFHSK